MHAILASMVCNPRITVPVNYIGETVQQRRWRGRPSVKGSEVGDAGEARARARIELQKEYQLPKVPRCNTVYSLISDSFLLSGGFPARRS